MSEFYNETKRKNTDYHDRYKNCNILEDLSNHEILLETREIDDIPVNILDIYHTVQPNEKGRLDLIAYKYYKNPLLWWVIAQANNIYNPIESPNSGDIIRIPNTSTLYGTNGVLL